MGKIIEFIFTRVYVAMLVTGIFWVLTICGGVLLGVGPASATIMSLYAENGMSYKDYHWSRAWELFKENLRPVNQVFYTFFAIEGGTPLWHVPHDPDPSLEFLPNFGSFV